MSITEADNEVVIATSNNYGLMFRLYAELSERFVITNLHRGIGPNLEAEIHGEFADPEHKAKVLAFAREFMADCVN